MDNENLFLQSDYYKNAPTQTIKAGLLKTYTYMLDYPKIIISVSGGSDSDCMLDVVEHMKKLMPEYWHELNTIHYVWFDTGIELEATKRHLQYLENRYNIEIERIKPEIQVARAVKTYGIPWRSKETSEWIHLLQYNNFDFQCVDYEKAVSIYPNAKAALKWFCREKGKYSSSIVLQNFLKSNPPNFSISQKCCTYSKKHPAQNYERDTDADISFLGIRKSESGVRHSVTSCFVPKNQKRINRFYPIFWWKDQDKLLYEHKYDIVHSDAYTKYGFSRTGCAGCPFNSDWQNDLAVLDIYEPNLSKGIKSIFKDSYNYSLLYKSYKEESKKRR